MPLSFKLHAELAAEHNGAERWGYRKLQCGTITATVPESKIPHMSKGTSEGTKEWEKLPKQDQAAQDLLTEAELPAGLDWVDAEVIEGWRQMGSDGATDTAQVHPYHFTTAMAELAKEAGVTIRTNCKVAKLETTTAGITAIEILDRTTGKTETVTDMTDVLVSAGPWSGRVFPKCGVEGLRAHSVVYEADVSPFAVFTDIELPEDYLPEHRIKSGKGKSHKGMVDPEIYARPFGEVYACGKGGPSVDKGCLLTRLGEPDSNIGLPETADLVQVDETQCDDMLAYIATVSPVLAKAPVKAKQACYLPQHSNGPLIGKTSIPGLFLASGHTCWGIQNGPGTGKLVSEFIFDGKAMSAKIPQLDPKKHKM